MEPKKSLLTIATTSFLATAASQTSASPLLVPDVVIMEFSGLFSLTDSSGYSSIQNVSYPYYGDPTWGYGHRTQISGFLKINTITGYGSATVNPFEFFSGGPFATSNFVLKSAGGSLMLGNMNSTWRGNPTTSQIVLDMSGLFSEWANNGYPTVGTVYDSSTCNASGTCATPASNDVVKSQYPIGPVPVATTSYNVSGNNGLNTTLNDIGLGIDDGIAGSPLDNGPFYGFNINLDFTSLEVSTIPVPASIWLFGTGLISLMGFARRRNTVRE